MHGRAISTSDRRLQGKALFSLNDISLSNSYIKRVEIKSASPTKKLRRVPEPFCIASYNFEFYFKSNIFLVETEAPALSV